jgi:hypothetical protein
MAHWRAAPYKRDKPEGTTTMKLHYSPGACSLGIHVILEEIGKPYELSLVALKDGALY